MKMEHDFANYGLNYGFAEQDPLFQSVLNWMEGSDIAFRFHHIRPEELIPLAAAITYGIAGQEVGAGIPGSNGDAQTRYQFGHAERGRSERVRDGNIQSWVSIGIAQYDFGQATKEEGVAYLTGILSASGLAPHLTTAITAELYADGNETLGFLHILEDALGRTGESLQGYGVSSYEDLRAQIEAGIEASPEARAIIAAQDAEKIAIAVEETLFTLHEIRSQPGFDEQDSVFQPGHPHLPLALAHMGGWSNASGGLRDMRSYLLGGQLDISGPRPDGSYSREKITRQLPGPANIDDVIGYISLQKEFINDDLDGLDWNQIGGRHANIVNSLNIHLGTRYSGLTHAAPAGWYIPVPGDNNYQVPPLYAPYDPTIADNHGVTSPDQGDVDPYYWPSLETRIPLPPMRPQQATHQPPPPLNAPAAAPTPITAPSPTSPNTLPNTAPHAPREQIPSQMPLPPQRPSTMPLPPQRPPRSARHQGQTAPPAGGTTHSGGSLLGSGFTPAEGTGPLQRTALPGLDDGFQDPPLAEADPAAGGRGRTGRPGASASTSPPLSGTASRAAGGSASRPSLLSDRSGGFQTIGGDTNRTGGFGDAGNIQGAGPAGTGSNSGHTPRPDTSQPGSRTVPGVSAMTVSGAASGAAAEASPTPGSTTVSAPPTIPTAPKPAAEETLGEILYPGMIHGYDNGPKPSPAPKPQPWKPSREERDYENSLRQRYPSMFSK